MLLWAQHQKHQIIAQHCGYENSSVSDTGAFIATMLIIPITSKSMKIRKENNAISVGLCDTIAVRGYVHWMEPPTWVLGYFDTGVNMLSYIIWLWLLKVGFPGLLTLKFVTDVTFDSVKLHRGLSAIISLLLAGEWIKNRTANMSWRSCVSIK